MTAPDGAFVIGSGFGQGYTESLVRSMFKVPSPSISSALEVMRTELLKLPLEALKVFEPLVPDVLEDTFGTVVSAVDAIMGALTDGPLWLKFAEWAEFLDGIVGKVGATASEAIANILDVGGDVVGILGSLLPLPISWLTDSTPNMLWEGGFDAPVTIAAGSDFVHDDADGVPGVVPVGCARLDADGEDHQMSSPMQMVGPGWVLEAGSWVKWESLTAAGSDPIRLDLVAFLQDAGNPEVFTAVGSPVMVASVPAPAGSSGGAGGWGSGPIQGAWTVPSDGSVTHVTVRPHVTDEATAGTVKFDNCFLRATQKMPQRFTDMLPEDLASLLNWTRTVVESALGALGITPSGNLLDDIFDLSDELDWIQQRANSAHADLSELIGDLLTDPAAVLGQLPQALVTGLSGSLSELNQIRDVLRGLVVTPINQAVQDVKDWWTGVQGRTQHLTPGGLLDHSRVTGLQSQIATGVDGLAEAVRDGAAAAAGTFTGIVDEAYQGILDLFGLANTARDIAITAQSQLQEITNDTEAPPELNGISWSTSFGGDLNSPLPSGDWPSVYNLVIKESGYLGISDSSPNNSIAWAVTNQAYATEGMSASNVLGPPRGKTGWDTLYSGVYVNCNSGFTSGAYAHIRPDRINFGRMQRAGTTFTFTQLATVSGTFKQGDIVRIRHYSGTYHVVVNGLTKISFTDSSNVIPRGTGYDRAGISQQRGQFSDLFGSWTNDSWRMAGFAMSDWLPAGVNVTAASWRLRRGSGGEVSLSVSHGEQTTMPSGFYTTNDLSAKVTITDLGTGTVTVTEDGWYEIMATSTNRDNFNQSPSAAAGTHEAGDNRASWRSTLWVLFVDGTPVAGPIMSGVPTTVYLSAGQQVRPGVSASWPLTGAGGHTGDITRQFAYSGRSAITHVSGAPSASFTGRKVG